MAQSARTHTQAISLYIFNHIELNCSVFVLYVAVVVHTDSVRPVLWCLCKHFTVSQWFNLSRIHFNSVLSVLSSIFIYFFFLCRFDHGVYLFSLFFFCVISFREWCIQYYSYTIRSGKYVLHFFIICLSNLSHGLDTHSCPLSTQKCKRITLKTQFTSK